VSAADVRETRLPTHGHRWSGPYGPLRPRRLVLEIAALVVAEALLLRVYGGYDSSFHWAAHFLVGVIATAAWLAVYLLVTSRPAPGQVLLVLPFHLYAMCPDLMYRAGIPHGAWSNAFLAHVDVHYIPGGDRTWLALASASLLGYAGLLSGWVAARTTEVDAGMPPGIGIGGRAVWTAQQDPAQVPLTYQKIEGASGFIGPAVVLLHGLGATGAVLLPLANELASSRAGGARRSGPSVVVPDLLGHGHSRHIGTDFGLTEQVAAVTGLLDGLQLQKVVLVGHSYGCAVAVAVAARDPRVSHLVLVCPPAYGDAAEAAERLSRRGWLARRTVAGAPAANAVCGLMCLLRPVLQRAAPRLAPGLPPAVARGGVQHSYPAYRAALQALLTDNPLPAAIGNPGTPTTVVLADQDTTAPAQDVLELPPGPGVSVTLLGGTHLLPLEHPAALASTIRQAVAP